MRTLRRATVGTLLGVGAALALPASPASAAVAYTTPTGEALSTLAASNGLTADQLASWNGLSATSYLAAGQTIYIPVPSELGVSASSTTTPTTTVPTTSTTTSTAASHTVITGDTLSAIAAANGVSPDAIAAANGISVDSVIVTGQTLAIPAATPPTTSTTTSPTSAPASGLSPIYCPCGTDYLAAPAAAQWNAMRQASIDTYGVDIYPAGPLSAYRTYAQQAYLYQQYLNGTGAPAFPPGQSPHEAGDSVDVATPEMRSIVDSIGSQFDWGKIYGPSEWWHVDYLGG